MEASHTQTLIVAAPDDVLAFATPAVLAAGEPNIVFIPRFAPVQERLP